jgi:hypothetical protein
LPGQHFLAPDPPPAQRPVPPDDTLMPARHLLAPDPLAKPPLPRQIDNTVPAPAKGDSDEPRRRRLDPAENPNAGGDADLCAPRWEPEKARKAAFRAQRCQNR